MTGVTPSDGDNLSKDSDEVHEMFCEQCEEHGVYAIACGFCVDCQDYMCDTCMVYHKRYEQRHKQLDKYNMPQDFCLEKCDNHREKVIKFYCEKCEKFACTQCKQDHKLCNLGHIPSLIQSKTVDVNSEMTSLTEQMHNMSKTLDETKEKIDQNLSKVLSLENDVKSKIQQGIMEKKNNFQRQTDEIINLFDKRVDKILANIKRERQEKMKWLAEQTNLFERKLSEGVEKVKFEIGKSANADQTKLNALHQECTGIAEDLKSLQYKLELKQKIGQESSIFVISKKMQPNIIKCQEKIKNVIGNNTTNCYEIDSEEVYLASEPTRLKHSLFTYGKIVKTTEAKVAIIPNTSLELQNEETSKPVTFSSLCLLNENKLIVANYKHSSIFVFNDLIANTHAKVVNLFSNPWDITTTKTNQIAVTLPDARSIGFLTIFDENIPRKPKYLLLGRKGYGIACIREHLVVSFLDPAEVSVITFSGTVINHLVRPSHGQISFISPLCLTLSADHSAVYISDSVADTVTCISFDGKVRAIYKDDQLKNPLHMAVDGNGSVYVCGRTSNNIHQLSSDLKKGMVLLDRQDLASPVSLAYCMERNRLYVGMKNKNVVSVFKIKEVQDGGGLV